MDGSMGNLQRESAVPPLEDCDDVQPGHSEVFPVFSFCATSGIMSAMENLFAQFVIELVRALLVDELSGRVRVRCRRLFAKRATRSLRGTISLIHRRNRRRLLHRLLTEIENEL